MNREATEIEKEQIVQDVCQLLYFLVTDVPNKIRMAEQRREALKHALLDGRKVGENPRLEAIDKYSSELFGWLAKKSKKYDKENPHDIFTANDLLDVLLLAQRKMVKKIKEKEVKAKKPKSTSAS